ncbi:MULTISPECIES: DUF2283 domain-containing protein [Desulfonatronovibrionaceae]|uniref:DUF2283 domain-containing protein n=1 Tax=Desulfonatronospira thiodismutans ASO3-1 TaxID=555779 RepID=D6SR31_9BACT|nr:MULTISPECIES: DUF2283 domain-containing protein [Desulfonatronovibrionaceae]EFI33147.1 Protein of unknown function DUF2283 [Desulfonatronospira thiodismutans ASO3-1]
MRIRVDKETDALYFRLDENKIVESEEVQPGVILDFDANNQVVGMEILNISKKTDKKNLSTMQFETV